jgi:hypothetical protein
LVKVRKASDAERRHGSVKGKGPGGQNPMGASGMKQARDARVAVKASRG